MLLQCQNSAAEQAACPDKLEAYPTVERTLRNDRQKSTDAQCMIGGNPPAMILNLSKHATMPTMRKKSF
jgi:hypothetical protein